MSGSKLEHHKSKLVMFLSQVKLAGNIYSQQVQHHSFPQDFMITCYIIFIRTTSMVCYSALIKAHASTISLGNAVRKQFEERS